MGWKLLTLVAAATFLGAVYWTFEPVIRDNGTETVADPGPLATPLPTAGPDDPVLVGAGDIASCEQKNDEKTALLVEQVVASGVETVVFTAGDNAYEEGTIEQYEQCYGPTWGRFKDRTRPALGNHEYYTGSADASFQYFGAMLGEPGKGYYSYDLGFWHIVVLNTSDHCEALACDTGSEQEQWLRADLAAHQAFCTLAIWHDPLFSSGATHGGGRYIRPFWRALYDNGADVVLNGHEHNYERFAPQTADGLLDTTYGIRQFVVGTGGNGHRKFDVPPAPNHEAANDATYGVLKLTLHPAAYDWEFIPEAGGAFSDSGSAGCHAAP